MATMLSGPRLVRGEPASGDLSSSLYLFAEDNGSGQLQVCNAAGDRALGVLDDDIADAAGKTAQIVYHGPCKVISGGAITKGADITTDGNGKAVVVSANGGGADVGKAILGRAMDAASGANEIIGAVINCINPAVAT